MLPLPGNVKQALAATDVYSFLMYAAIGIALFSHHQARLQACYRKKNNFWLSRNFFHVFNRRNRGGIAAIKAASYVCAGQ